MDSITQGTQKTGANPIFIGIMIVGLLAVGGLIAWLLLSPAPQRTDAPQLVGALREGAEFEELKRKIVIDPQRDFTTESRSLAGGLQMNLVAVIRNFTGKTLTGLEVIASVVDKDGKVVKEKAAVVIPGEITSLAPNKTTPITVIISGFEEKDDRANFKWRVSAIKVE